MMLPVKIVRHPGLGKTFKVEEKIYTTNYLALNSHQWVIDSMSIVRANDRNVEKVDLEWLEF